MTSNQGETTMPPSTDHFLCVGVPNPLSSVFFFIDYIYIANSKRPIRPFVGQSGNDDREKNILRQQHALPSHPIVIVEAANADAIRAGPMTVDGQRTQCVSQQQHKEDSKEMKQRQQHFSFGCPHLTMRRRCLAAAAASVVVAYCIIIATVL